MTQKTKVNIFSIQQKQKKTHNPFFSSKLNTFEKFVPQINECFLLELGFEKHLEMHGALVGFNPV